MIDNVEEVGGGGRRSRRAWVGGGSEEGVGGDRPVFYTQQTRG